ncbi:MAG TPA: HlyD family efflux transporter periplasmic adaptor subunit [Usitatibacter sp.]|nr:HlyD family efflux transporter periplasmic adaptor subunit [Usitatibacter sp.]
MDTQVTHVEVVPAAGSAAAARPWLRRTLVGLLLIAAALGGGYRWWSNRPAALPAGIAMSNGRLEATEVDVAARTAGRVKEVLAREGDVVAEGQLLARMDVATLEAAHRQALAQVAQAREAVATARAAVDERQSALDLAASTLRRTEDLVARGFVSAQKLDGDRAQWLAARASLVAARSRVVEAQAGVVTAEAAAQRIVAEIADADLFAPRAGRVQYRLAHPGEVVGAGGKVLTLLDLSDVYMTVFFAEAAAGSIAIGAEARLVLDAIPQYVIPATVSFVASEAQFTPKTVETPDERQKLVFRVKVQVDPALLRQYQSQVKSGVPGVAYVRTRAVSWPANLQPRLPGDGEPLPTPNPAR